MPGACCTRGLVCNSAQRARTRAYRSSRNTPAFPAQWLYGLYRTLPGERLFCLRRSREAYVSGIWRQHRDVRTTRLHRTRQPRSSVVTPASTASHRTFVTIAKRPSSAVRRAELNHW